jgi:hypothetical protein
MWRKSIIPFLCLLFFVIKFPDVGLDHFNKAFSAAEMFFIRDRHISFIPHLSQQPHDSGTQGEASLKNKSIQSSVIGHNGWNRNKLFAQLISLV